MSHLFFLSIYFCVIQYAISQRVSSTTIVSNGLQYNPNSVVGTVRPSLPRMVPDVNTLPTPGVSPLAPSQMNPMRPNQQGVAYGANVQGFGPNGRTQGSNPYGMTTFGPQVPYPYSYQGFNAPNQGYSPYGVVDNGAYGLFGPYGGTGNGNVEVNGDLPVTGTAAVYGQVPLNGKVAFNGDVAAGGVVTISGTCGCSAPYSQQGYGSRQYRRI